MKAMGVHVDRRTVLVAGAVALGVSLVSLVAYAIVDAIVEFGVDSNWPFAFYAVILVGMALGGRVAGRIRPDAPLAHASLAALGAMGVIAVISVVIDVVLENGIVDNLVKLVAQIPVLVAAAAVSAYVVARRSHR
jgi:hypothetical protein